MAALAIHRWFTAAKSHVSSSRLYFPQGKDLQNTGLKCVFGHFKVMFGGTFSIN